MASFKGSNDLNWTLGQKEARHANTPEYIMAVGQYDIIADAQLVTHSPSPLVAIVIP